MINILSNLKRSEAAGLLARTAMFLSGHGDTFLDTLLPNEQDLRGRLLDEIKQSLGIDREDTSQVSLDSIRATLDELLDEYTESDPKRDSLRSLSLQGNLPSDLYVVNVIDQVKDLYGRKWFEEQKLIHETVKAPDQEQHMTSELDSQVFDGGLFSLFLKRYSARFVGRTFNVLVVGRRTGLILDVHQCWRIYQDDDVLLGSDLIDILRRFSNKYGFDFKYKDSVSKFVLDLNPVGEARDVSVEVVPIFVKDSRGRKVAKDQQFYTSIFQSRDIRGVLTSVLINVLDKDRYLSMLKQHGW